MHVPRWLPVRVQEYIYARAYCTQCRTRAHIFKKCDHANRQVALDDTEGPDCHLADHANRQIALDDTEGPDCHLAVVIRKPKHKQTHAHAITKRHLTHAPDNLRSCYTKLRAIRALIALHWWREGDGDARVKLTQESKNNFKFCACRPSRGRVSTADIVGLNLCKCTPKPCPLRRRKNTTNQTLVVRNVIACLQTSAYAAG